MLLNLRTLAWICVLPLSAAAVAQFTLSDGDKAGAAPQVTMGGLTAFDLIPTKEGGYMFPLRFGHVMEGSERVDLDGKLLVREKDYTVDYTSGVIYLKQVVSANQSLRVQYRYDQTQKREGTYGMGFAGGLNNFMFRLNPGSQFVLGLGQTERLADGTVLTSNIYGLQNSFSLGSGTTLSGVMMVGERTKAESSDLLGQDTGGTSNIEEGTGTAVVQSLQTQALGGSVRLDYQSIDDKFNGFQAMKDSGMDAGQVGALQKERGLKRTGFSLSEIGGGGLNFSSGYNWVGDATGGVTWRQYGMNVLGVSANWSSQYVDPNFNAFGKLREADAAQLAKERGLDRQNFNLSAPLGGDRKLTFDNLTIATQDGENVIRQSLGFDTGSFKGGYFDQRIDSGFTRFNDLREEDRKQLEKERGMYRRNWNFGGSALGLNFSSADTRFGRDGDGMSGRDYGLAGNGWGFNYTLREVDSAFRDFGSMTGDDRKLHLDDVVKMYDAGANPHKNDANGLGDLSGFSREAMRFSLDQGGWGAKFQSVAVSNETAGTRLEQIDLSKGGTSLSMSRLRSDDDFTDFHRMLWSEQQRLGRVDGLDKFDLKFGTQLGSAFKLTVDHMVADSPNGGARRDLVGISGQNFGFNLAKRSVDETFQNVGAMADSETQLLSGLVGFDQSQSSGFWQAMPGLRFDFNEAKAVSSIFDQSQLYREMRLGWALSPHTGLAMARIERNFIDKDAQAVDQQYEQFQLRQGLGRAGQVTLTHEQHQFDGTTDTLPDAVKQTLEYQTKLNERTEFKTEQSVTRFETGARETTSSNTLATKLSDRLGVSVTDTQVRRDGDAPDETRRDYGFWVDFGAGIRFDYQYKRNMRGEDFGQHQTSTKLSGGEVGGVKLDGASYNHNRLDGQRNTHLGNVSLSNVNPFKFGLLDNVKFYYRTDTQRDFVAWKKEDLATGLSMSIGQVGFGYDYNSQINPNGFRAIDRVFSLSTDKDGSDRLRADLKYGVRTLPDNEDVMIRDYKVTFDASKQFSLSHALVTNPIQEKKDVLLGSLPLDERRNSWTAKYQNDKRWAFDLNWNEIKRQRLNESLRREARMNMTMFADTASPMQLSYALQEWNRNENRMLSHTLGLSYMQVPSANQSFMFSLEHMNWMHGRPESSTLRDWQFRLDYSLRF